MADAMRTMCGLSNYKYPIQEQIKPEKMEVKIISQELIKPSSPTPQHLRTFKLSLLEQLVDFPHTPLILFYPASNSGPDVPQKLDLLKKTLSRTLTRFYPLAGRIWDELYVECDDAGASFVEASVNKSLCEFLADPDLASLNQLLHGGRSHWEVPELTNVQVSVFQCGGLAIGMCNSHKLHDGAAQDLFLKDWVAFAREGDGGGSSTTAVAAQDLMVAAELFPANDLSLRDHVMTTCRSVVTRPGNSATKRFLFSGPVIETLRARGKSSGVENPSRVEAVSGFLWKCVMTAFERKNNGLKRPSTFTEAVNIRKRMLPPLPETSLGNLVLTAVGHCDRRADGDDTLPSLVGKLRSAISKVDGDLLLGMTRDTTLIRSFFQEIAGTGSSEEKADLIMCTSLCKRGYYDADFGWGRPVWVGNMGIFVPVVINLIVLLDTRAGDGIEAWVTLDKTEMAILQEDPELLSFASVNPSPLIADPEP